ncbi:hypothetical protein L596_015305 [Steinernema carpocapsae]|uniref:Uncharacterized protein n=1 Tax=Steinernema carpocapsae TaxID=34508 RepID=A0A4U5NEK2_STECR|nr:hypothetical protein L596_015305 [Steinernema carpocapsae]
MEETLRSVIIKASGFVPVTMFCFAFVGLVFCLQISRSETSNPVANGLIIMQPKFVLPPVKNFNDDCCHGAEFCLINCLLSGYKEGHCFDGTNCTARCVCQTTLY